jgi:hypothetical protein
MLFKISRILTTFGLLAVASSSNTAFGQFGFYNPCCCCPPPVRVQPCYQTVPVTEMREVRQVVQKPVVETKYVEQPVTEYRQVVETKTAEVPTVSYQNVTEYRTVQRDCGHWITQYHCRPKMAPCQYDSRPDLLGFLNRTQYSVRMAFTPNYYGERIYVPNVVAQQVPVTRQVAIRGTQTVNYQVAKVVPIHSTRKVAVNTVRMVSQEVVTQQPVTVMRTVPVGSAYAFGVPSNPSSTTAQAPAAAPDSGVMAIRPRDALKRPASSEGTGKVPDPLQPDEHGVEDDRESDASKSNIRGKEQGALHPQPAPLDDDGAVLSKASARPIGRWVARRKAPSGGPAFPDMTIARNDRK